MVRLSPRSFRVVADHERRPTLSSAPPEADHVGALLCEARTAAGYALSDIAYTLRIRYLFLQAIEEGRFADLPGAAYAVGFVRSYADYLGLDSAAVVARFKAETDGARSQTSLAFPEGAPERRFFPGASVIILSILLGSAAFGGWIYLQDETDLIAQRIADPPALPAFDLSRGPSTASTQASSRPAINLPPQPAVDAKPVVDPPQLTANPAEPPSRPDPVAPAPDAPAVAVATPAQPPIVATPSPVEADSAAPRPPVAVAIAPLVPEQPGQQLVTRLTEALPAPILATADAAQPELAQQAPVQLGSTPLDLSIADGAPSVVESPRGANSTAAIAAEVPSPSQAEALPQLASRGDDPAGGLGLPAVPLAGALDSSSGRVYGQANKDARIILRATADSWVQVRDGAQNVLLTRMLRAGDSYQVPDKADLWLLTGNAGGLEILVDGQRVAPLGGAGEVRRDVALDTAALKAR